MALRRWGRWLRLAGGLGLLGAVSLVHGASTVYVQARSAQVRDGKTSLNKTVATVQFGEALEVLQQEAEWLEVRTAGGARGWIFVDKTSTSKPAGASAESGLAKLGQGLRQTQASPVTASAGARGLDKASEDYAQRSGITRQHRDAVDRMTAYRLPEQDVETFLKEGKLGEYAR